jgi:hypothetical protein
MGLSDVVRCNLAMDRIRTVSISRRPVYAPRARARMRSGAFSLRKTGPAGRSLSVPFYSSLIWGIFVDAVHSRPRN